MDDKAKAAKIAKLRKQAENKDLPQDVRNQFLDNANALELELGKKANPGMFAKGGSVAKAPAKKMMYGGMAEKKPAMAKGGSVAKAPAKKPAIAIMIAVGKPKVKKGK